MVIKINDIILHNGRKAQVEFIDTTSQYSNSGKSKIGIRYLEGPFGNFDGKIGLKRLFNCKKNYGRMVEISQIKSFNLEEFAAITIQRVFRSYLSRLIFHKRVAFEFWNHLESCEEKEILSYNRDVGAVMEKNIEKQRSEDKMKDSIKTIHSNSSIDGEDGALEVNVWDKRSLSNFDTNVDMGQISSFLEDDLDPFYAGPQMGEGITVDFAQQLLEYFRDDQNAFLPRKYAARILIETENHYKKLSTGAVIHVQIPKKSDARLVLVGDTHGQLNDVLWIFYKFDAPSMKNIYVFNGDIADRGSNSVEIFLILFAFLLAEPQCVTINRGNHESAEMNEAYGFAQEVRQKYGGAMYQIFQTIFGLLPLCVVIEERVVVVHGGLFRKDNVTLNQIDSINRNRPCPSNPQTFEDTLMFDILWSDPRSENGRGFSPRGTDCITFGPDVTSNFLRRNKLEVCIRSHQVPSNSRGFEPLHGGQCVTLFSASNYCGTTGNYGGVIIFEAGMSFEIQEYMAPSIYEICQMNHNMRRATKKISTQSKIKEMESMTTKKLRRNSTILMENDIMNKICKLICENKHELWRFFHVNDELEAGFATPAIMRAGFSAVLCDGLPWFYLMKKMKIKSNKTIIKDNKTVELIDYNKLLSRFKVVFKPPNFKHADWQHYCIQGIFESILAADLSLKEILLVFDRDCDGTVSFREFSQLLKELNIDLSEPQIKLLMRVIMTSFRSNDVKKKSLLEEHVNRIEVAEFLGRFKVKYSNVSKINCEADEWIKDALSFLGKAILSDRVDAAKRYYEKKDFVSCSSDKMNEIADNRRRSSTVRAVALFQKFREFCDSETDGFMSYSNFVQAMKNILQDNPVTNSMGFDLTDEHLMKIAETIDATKSKKINYLEFLNAFHVIDDNKENNFGDQMWEQICTTLFQQKNSIRRSLHTLDPGLTGKIKLNDFKSVLVTLNNVLLQTGSPFTIDQIESLVGFLDVDDHGLLEYEELLDSMHPVDTLSKEV